MIRKIISGGQTGVDRAALDAAIKLAIAHGGSIPKGRITEDGPLPDTYNLKETRSSSYAERTAKNVQDADGTLIISRGQLTGGSEYTREMAVKLVRNRLHASGVKLNVRTDTELSMLADTPDRDTREAYAVILRSQIEGLSK